jgi:hypothetical protein
MQVLLFICRFSSSYLGFVKGHGFSRADYPALDTGALAAEVHLGNNDFLRVLCI